MNSNMYCFYTDCKSKGHDYKNKTALRRHLKDIHHVVFKKEHDRKAPSGIDDNDNNCIYPLCQYSIDDKEAYLRHLEHEHNLLDLHKTNPHVSRYDLRSPGRSASKTVDHVETSPELSDMDVSNSGSVHIDEDAGPSTKKRRITEFTELTEDNTYEDAGPSTTKRHITEFSEVTEEGTYVDRATKTPTLSSPVRRKGKGRSVSFTPSTKTLTSPHKPKLYKEDVKVNEDDYIFGTSAHVDEELQEEFSGNQTLNLDLVSLKAIPNAWDYLKNILDAEDPSEAILRCTIPTDQTSHNGKFLSVIRGTMTDFCYMYYSMRDPLPADNMERTFWVESVIPMFKYFAGITELIKFRWCETPTESRSIATMDQDTLTSAPVRFLDGLGTTKDKEILLMEASSGAIHEHVAHTRDDTVKLIAAATEVLKADAAKHQNSSFSSYLKLKVLTVHTAKNVMTLSSVSYTEQKKYKVMELRTAEIPLGWNQRLMWFHVFDLLANIMEILVEQETVYEQLKKEKYLGGVPAQETLRLRIKS